MFFAVLLEGPASILDAIRHHWRWERALLVGV